MAELNNELIEKAKQAKSAEEILALAKENGMEMTEEQAKSVYAQLHPTSGEISDDELDNVAGGGCGDSGNTTKPRCPKCGSEYVQRIPGTGYTFCASCEYLDLDALFIEK